MLRTAAWAAVGALAVLISAGVVPAQERFVANGDGTVTDNQLGVMWSATDNQGDISWKDARAWTTYTFGMTIDASYDNWRLPTIRELESLYVTNPVYRGTLTPDGQRVKIWPAIQISSILIWSDEQSMGSGVAFDYSMGTTFAIPSYQIEGCRALPVRDLQ